MPMLPSQARAVLPPQAGGVMRPAMPPQAGGVMRPAMPVQAQGVPQGPGMKKGGFVPFAKAKAGDAKGGEKKMPPWLEKGKDKKFAKGGLARADGIAKQGRTRGKFC